MSQTALIWDERYLQHKTGSGHPERPERLKAIHEILKPENSFSFLSPRRAKADEVAWVHSLNHVHEVESLSGIENTHYFDGDTPISGGSSDAAFLAAGGVLNLIDAVEDGHNKNGFAFPRPPGHHAEVTHAMGFCLFNNVAIGAEYLIRTKNKKRVAIVDFDVHHGNGTQHFFYERSNVFFASTHRFPFYPGTGAKTETGRGVGEGFTLNVPFSGRADDDDYERAFEETIVPALIDYKPDFILVSAGFDAHKLDPLGGMNISKNGFAMMSKNLQQVAKKMCAGKIVYVLEGGYDLKGLQEGVEACLSEM